LIYGKGWRGKEGRAWEEGGVKETKGKGGGSLFGLLMFPNPAIANTV